MNMMEGKDDTISRRAARDAMLRLYNEDLERFGVPIPETFDADRAAQAINELPAVQPQRMRGRWIKSDTDGFVCSVCRNGYKMQPTIMGEPMFEFWILFFLTHINVSIATIADCLSENGKQDTGGKAE